MPLSSTSEEFFYKSAISSFIQVELIDFYLILPIEMVDERMVLSKVLPTGKLYKKGVQEGSAMLFLFLTALCAAVTLISGGIAIYERFIHVPRPHQPKFAFAIAAGTLFLTIIFLLASISSLTGNPNPPIQNTPTSTPSRIAGITPTPPTPTPTPISCSAPCTLYQAGGSDGWKDWSYPQDWRVVGNGLLLGTASGGKPGAVAPFTLPQGISKFAVEAVIAVPEDISHGADGFGITACGSTTGDGWQGYSGGVASGLTELSGYIERSAAIDLTKSKIGNGDFDPGTHFRTYDLEINLNGANGNVLTLKVDGAPVVSNTVDDRFTQCGSQVGLWNDISDVIQIKSFKVVAL